jgi:NAD+ synthase (glutamine-hydrolysing)
MLRIAIGQMSGIVGAVHANSLRMRADVAQAKADQAHIVVFPELSLSGYPPDDLLLRPGFIRSVCDVRDELMSHFRDWPDVIFGHPHLHDGQLYNAATWCSHGQSQVYHKRELPNYAVFDEKRHFRAGQTTLVRDIGGVKVGLLICEDIWFPTASALAKAAGAQLLIAINASPYNIGKFAQRLQTAQQRVAETGLPLLYVHWNCGQDDVVYDGQSFAVNANGELIARAPACEEGVYCIEFDPDHRQFLRPPWHQNPPANEMEIVYKNLVLATRDYIRHNGFSDVLFGLSGGIDSALILAIAVDALGAKHVHTYMLPSAYTSALSLQQARAQAVALGVSHANMNIEPTIAALTQTLAPEFAGLAADITEENLQSRCRAILLMALSNKHAWMLLSTGNKSEMAMGYATIYGDMCGGFAPIKDVYKTQVYQLCAYRNSLGPVIPQAVIDRPPSAELREGQTDQDSLPPYATLDEILYRFIELEQSRDEIIDAGFDAATVQRVVRSVLMNEYKRRQAPPGPKISIRAFGRDRRYPITSGYR